MSPSHVAGLLLAVAVLAGCERRAAPGSQGVPAESASASAAVGAEPAEVDEPAEGGAMGATQETPEAEALRSGVTGRATIGPACPVVEAGVECPERPYATSLVIREVDSDRVVANVTSDAEGRFRVELPPGAYLIEGEPAEVIYAPKAEPVRFEVEPGSFTEVVIHFDSGIR